MAWWGWGMGWGRGRGRGWIGPWPGRGPFSYLPPWQRPGWLYGRGSCWWLFGGPWNVPGYGYYWPWMPYYYPPSLFYGYPRFWRGFWTPLYPYW